ncbi:MAG: protease modulator HflC [Alphaproteobacteria bacterium]
MFSRNLTALMIPLVILGFFAMGSFFVVLQTQQALLLQFGKLIRVIQEPGLKLKIPFVQEVHYYDKRMLDLDISAIEATLGDQKRVIVDTFIRYRIHDPSQFYKTVFNEMGAQSRLTALVTGTLRNVLGNTPLMKLLTVERTQIMHHVRSQVDAAARSLGIQVVELRIRRLDLPKQNSQAIFNRMISERQKEAQELRAKGKELSETIRAQADRDKVVLLADAAKKAEILKGEGDAISSQLYAEAYGKSPEFAMFYRSLQAYKVAFKDDTTTFLLSPDNDFLKFFRKHSVGR